MSPLKILLLMLLCHVIDDFVLQPVCLSKLKQEAWWKSQKEFSKKYKYDYYMALLMHAMSWSIMIVLPIIFFGDVGNALLLALVVLNTGIHLVVDDMKANTLELNLIQDQTIHLIQVFFTWFFLSGLHKVFA